MRSLRSAQAPLLLLTGFLAVLALVLTACDKQEPTDGLGDGSAPESSEATTPSIDPGGTTTPPADTGDTSKIDVASLTSGRWYAAAQGDPYLEFTEQGAVSGTDGCNAIASSWKAEGDEISVKPFTTTQKACAGVDSWLGNVSKVKIDGDTMTVLDVKGNEIGELKKVEK